MHKEYAPMISELAAAGRMKHQGQFLDNQQQSDKHKMQTVKTKNLILTNYQVKHML